MNTPELRVRVNRDKVLDVGANVDVVGRTLETMLGGRLVTRFKRDGEQYDVIVQVARDGRDTPERISEINVRNRAGDMVPLSNLVTVREGVSLRGIALPARARRPSTPIWRRVHPGRGAGHEQSRQAGVTDYGADRSVGPAREFRDSSSDALCIPAAGAGLHLSELLAAQFRKLRRSLHHRSPCRCR